MFANLLATTTIIVLNISFDFSFNLLFSFFSFLFFFFSNLRDAIEKKWFQFQISIIQCSKSKYLYMNWECVAAHVQTNIMYPSHSSFVLWCISLHVFHSSPVSPIILLFTFNVKILFVALGIIARPELVALRARSFSLSLSLSLSVSLHSFEQWRNMNIARG